jgi:hypothetical protein
MATRCGALTSLGLSLVFASGCPEPEDEAGDESVESGDTGESGDSGATSDGGSGVEDGGGVRPPLDTGDGDGDDDGGPVDVRPPLDTVVYIHDQECGTRELGCNDDFIGLDSKLTVKLEQFQLITVTVDGAGPFEEGPLVLTVYEADPPTCAPELIVPVLPTEIVGDTTGALSELVGDCGGEDAPERVYEFVAPGPGSYRFDTAGSSFDTVLYTLEACDGAPLLCNDDANFTLQSQLIVDLDGGEKVLVAVDGHHVGDFGPFVLHVEEI